MFRPRWALAVALAICLALPACRRPRQPRTLRFRYWGDSEEIRIIQGLISDFEAAHPGVHIKAERKGADSSYADELLAEFSAHDAPDVMFLSTDNVDVIAKDFKLADLRPWLANDKRLKASDYSRP